MSTQKTTCECLNQLYHPKTGSNQESFNRWLGKQAIVHLYNGKLFRNKIDELSFHFINEHPYNGILFRNKKRNK